MSNLKAANRRYMVRMAVLMSAYLALVFTAAKLLGDGGVSGAPAYALAIAPAVPILGVFWALARFLIELDDEYLRYLQVRQMIVATCFALTIGTVYGFLEEFELVPFIPSYHVTTLWFLGLGVGAAYNKLTIGDAVCNA